MPDIKTCIHCIHFNPTQYFKRGECRKRAPVVVKMSGSSIDPDNSQFPNRDEDDWCGDFDGGGR